MKSNAKNREKSFAVAKAKTGEREIGRILSNWWGEPHSFKRRVRALKNESDIETPESFGFELEVKNQKGFNLQQVFNKKNMLSKWMQQAEEQAKAKNKDPLLLFKVANIGWFCALYQEDAIMFPFNKAMKILHLGVVVFPISELLATCPSLWEK